MAWFSFEDSRGRGWAINPDGAAHVIRSNQYNRLLLERSRIVKKSHAWQLPTVTEVDTDFSNIRAATSERARPVVEGIVRDAAQNPALFYEFLVNARQDGESAGQAYVDMNRRASRETASAIDSSVHLWENAASAARFVRDVSAGSLLIGATVLSGGAMAFAVGAGGGLTFTGSTQDNLESGQTLRQAMGNATISTGVAITTNFIIPRGLGAAATSMTGRTALTLADNLTIGLLTVQANVAGDIIKTALTAAPLSTPEARAAAAGQFERQMGTRAAFEVASMLFGSWLQSKGIPAHAILNQSDTMITSVTGGTLNAIGDRVVSAMASQDQSRGDALGRDLDIAFTGLLSAVQAEGYVREVAMYPV